MTKWYGVIGYIEQKETAPGVWEEIVLERPYYGDVIRNSIRYHAGTSINDDVNISNQLSILVDPFGYENFQLIKYVTLSGHKWKVSNIELQYPRIVLTLGGLYNE